MFLIPINSDGINTHSTIQQNPIHINGGIDTVKNNVDMNTHYPGGKAAWNLFFRKNFKYREEDMKNGINGLIVVHFIITSNGHISNAKIVSGIDKASDREVLRVINMMPDWIPVLDEGKPVDVPFVLSVPLHQDSPSDLVSGTYNNEGIVTKPIDQAPQYPGGYTAMLKFLHDKMQYPTIAQESRIQGTVIVRFVVRSTGKVTNVEVLKGIGIGCDDEAVRVVKEMPNWIPGRDKGIAVSYYFQIPIKFQLQMNNYTPRQDNYTPKQVSF